MTAHPQQANIIEEDHTQVGIRMRWWHENRPNKHIIAARLIYDCTAVVVKITLKHRSLLSNSPATKIWETMCHKARWLTTCVRINERK
jgi:hypothetical protein